MNMKARSIVFVILILLCVHTNSAIPGENADSTRMQPDLKESLTPVLHATLLSLDDLILRDDYLEKDSMRIELVDSFMADPFYMNSFPEELYSRLKDDPSLSQLVDMGARILSPLTRGYSPIANAKSQLQSHNLKTESPAMPPPPEADRRFAGLPISLRIALNNILNAGMTAEDKYQGAFYEVDKDSLVYGLTSMLYDDELNEKKTVEELDSLSETGEEWAKALVDILPYYRLGTMLNGGRILATAIDNTLRGETEHYFEDLDLTEIWELETELGMIAVGTKGNDNYEGNYFLIIDPEGDDTYSLTPVYGGQFNAIIDFTGNDIYRFVNDSLYTFTERAKVLNERPPGIGGYKYLIDYEGNDVYTGADFSIAAGILGISVFKDYKGDDTYLTDNFGQAAAAMGIGFLLDYEGRDTYNGAMYNEGYGFTGGVAVLFDREGHDNYISGGKYGDVLRYVDHYITFSQGSAYGLRPYFSGGIGMLLDGSGNDLYVSDIFGQASGYWYSAGIIYDIAGNDRYQSFQYAQGSGTHMAVGCLRDDSGDDAYFSKGVSQGCGHDYAQGWLIDYSGSDVYSSHDLSQGAGSANGIGVITDFEGDDRYYVKSDRNTQGYGNPRRSFGSIGLLYDASGADRYDGGPGKDGDIWIYSKWGIGWDQPADSAEGK